MVEVAIQKPGFFEEAGLLWAKQYHYQALQGRIIVNERKILVAGCVMGGLAVALGAFGAHWLEGAVADWDLLPDEQAKRLATWEVAVRYQMYHAFALLAVGLLADRGNHRLLGWSAKAFIAGTTIFSGCLYLLVLSGVKILGAIVPIGGTCLIAGWILLAVAVCKCEANSGARE